MEYFPSTVYQYYVFMIFFTGIKAGGCSGTLQTTPTPTPDTKPIKCYAAGIDACISFLSCLTQLQTSNKLPYTPI